MAKIMDRFKVDIKATPDKDYFASIYTIKKKYLIKPGDRIYKVYYDGRGRTWYDTEVIEATDDYIIINDGEIQIKLLYSKEPDYRQWYPDCQIVSEERDLVIKPFPTFVDSFNKDKIAKVVNPSTDLFYSKNGFIKDFKPYLRNFKNIEGQMTLKKLYKMVS